MKINNNIINLDNENIFAKVSEKVNKYKLENPNEKLISLGIGDVTFPVVKPIINAMHKAVDDLSKMDTFKGYGSYYGYDFLKDNIRKYDYKGINLSNEEIYISNGSKTDTTSILELFDIDSKICVPELTYPIYKDGSLCLNRTINIIPVSEKKEFLPIIPKEKYDIIYLCSPSNPLGIAFTKKELTKWVKYALKYNSVILYDNVYYSFIRSKNVPKSIYEISDAKKVAIEFRSFSKKASFTGVRCSYYVIPNEITENVNYFWKKRTINRFNGTDYIAQKGANASYLKRSTKLINKNINEYIKNAEYLKKELSKLDFKIIGGSDSPYMWIKTKNNMDSWEYFDFMLKELQIIIIPGCIFGNKGNGYFRISSLGTKADIKIAVERIKKYYEK